MRKILMVALCAIIATSLFVAVGCVVKPDDEHHFSTTFSYDENTHWRACTDEGCTEVTDSADHSYELVGTVKTCSTCGYGYDTANTYEINLETMGKTVVAGVTVTLFDSNNVQVAEAKTNIRGRIRFSNLNPGDYVAKIDAETLPKGFYLTEDLESLSLSASVKEITAKIPSTIIDESIPASKRYSVGDVAYNLTTTTVDEKGATKTISLSAYLSKFNAVVLNFWYQACNPCMQEFPYMDEAYRNYQDKIAVIAINSGAENASEVADFVASSGYSFDFVNNSETFQIYNSAFNVKAYPTTVIIDRYGVIAHVETGSIPSLSAWENMFSYYTSSDYVPDYKSSYNGSAGTPDGGNNLAKPDVEMEDSETIAAKITKTNSYTTATTFTYTEEDDEYSWPWVLDVKDGVDCLKTSNKNRVNSYSILMVDVELRAGQQVFVDYFSSTELDGDILYVQVDTVLQRTISGENSTWNNDELLYTARRDGKYRLSLTYQKDTMNHSGEDTFYIKNLRIEQGANVANHVDILYNAVDNYTLDQSVTVPTEYSGFVNHVAYYYNEDDGFYHVALSGNANDRAANDPILLADLYYSTPWNSLSVWNLAYAETGLFNSADPDYKEGYYQAIEDYAWLQNNNDSRYVPLTKELQQILVDVIDDLGRTDHTDDPHNGVDQWLEVCRYYVHYGAKEIGDTCFALDNTVEALKWRVAKDYGTMTSDKLIDYVDAEGVTHSDVFLINVDVYSVHLPRGNYYRFKTTTAGVYLIRSHAALASDYDVNGQDPLGFLSDDKGNILAENDNFIIEVQGYGKDENDVVQTGNNRYALYDNNFYIYMYLEADTTYHVAGCFNDPYAMGKYDVSISYLGASYTYFTSCATDPAYTYDENDPTFTPFILPLMGKDRFFIADDGNYYAQEYDSSQGSLLYIRLVGPTYFNSYSNLTLEQMIEQDAIGTTEAERLYMKHLLIEARTTYDEDHELYGYVVATQELVAIINKMANGSEDEDSNMYSQTSWLLTAYYYRTVNELTLQEATAKYNK